MTRSSRPGRGSTACSSPSTRCRPNLRAHVRYPDDLFRAQTARYVTYHMNTPATFYNREDEWQVPVVTRKDESVPFMRHIVMRLPDEKEAEFIYMAPFTPRGKGQPGGVDGGAERWRRVRQASRLSLPAADARLRSAADREPHQPEHRDLAAGVAVGPARIAGDTRRPAGHPDRGGIALRAAAVPGRKAARSPSSSGWSWRTRTRWSCARRSMRPSPTCSAAPSIPAGPRRWLPRTARLLRAARRRRAGSTPPPGRRSSRPSGGTRQPWTPSARGDWARYGEEIRQLGALLERLQLNRPPM